MNDPEEPLNSVSYIDRLSRCGLSIVRVHWTDRVRCWIQSIIIFVWNSQDSDQRSKVAEARDDS